MYTMHVGLVFIECLSFVISVAAARLPALSLFVCVSGVCEGREGCG